MTFKYIAPTWTSVPNPDCLLNISSWTSKQTPQHIPNWIYRELPVLSLPWLEWWQLFLIAQFILDTSVSHIQTNSNSCLLCLQNICRTQPLHFTAMSISCLDLLDLQANWFLCFCPCSLQPILNIVVRVILIKYKSNHFTPAQNTSMALHLT